MEHQETSMVVAVSPQIGDDGGLMVLPEYFNALSESGLRGIMIALDDANEHSPITCDAAACTPIARLLPPDVAGILVPGGDDIDPRLYEQEPLSTTQAPHPVRDALEPRLIKFALERNIPLLGICRGMQMMNVVQGGTLIQSLSDALAEATFATQAFQAEPSGCTPDRTTNPGHSTGKGATQACIHMEDAPQAPSRAEDTPQAHIHNQEATRTRSTHTVSLLPHTPLNPSSSPLQAGVNSLHNQAVDQLGTSVTPCAIAEDNIIEGLYIQGPSFALGVQWHPELMEDKQARNLVFGPFAAACKAYLCTKR